MERSDDLYLKSLETYVQPAPAGAEGLFPLLLCGTLFMFLCVGWGLGKVTLSMNTPAELVRKIKVSFNLEDQVERKKPKKAIDLTKKPILKQKENVVVKQIEPAPVRQVYGVRRVYSVGLGSGGPSSDAIVSKLGNTLDKDPDTLTATERDLKGPLASITTITAMPQLLTTVKPVYTDEMKKNGVQGVVSAKLLIDIDGLVKQVQIINDLGFGTRESALEAFKKLAFKPALQGTSAVAVWIVMKFRFVLQE
ncbi:MAG: hypothetical protein A2268_08480 [Candidatus Raymondbacteria bacterium RifOxyA12_full_50_37]|uniref:TonB C-terminal domain-containing protein n=1 Tax=Candidatus Raymondbacteria bacterium RIFOXYD12_FULL_49_13 TaxID=1817890 RepID=A0A1F7F463_UNCRA|nr:MAG: hypothetical protein A2268_08480 [Candidatus Raymondbacteria bacterium RifOxyA12_full_50_37]OGJ90369.1 MAG: hypothetical protein A2248_17415 [Candidatus Raymondbacteria bacterium RIFOXYA2_FULL_49_16]OGK01296.1 MAG: hypothetical protein A2519_12900 [Candidatus Raymondbacteria bacterium RIFOXYD12_FULL_49_13]OGK03911.1 MAG: hypothetical protein A2487_16245 [Candidatus Raymondbacteria bacterium RifOxyC12_full_50_8]OGP43268.1 MAG: hypothetical protein A2324_08245 [Candidatus Raymondbacteria 